MSSKRRSSTKNLDESSVIVQDSPVSSMKQKGNLTGNVRVMRDHVFQMNVLIQQWNAELLDGTAAVGEIKSIMFKKINAKTSEAISYVSILQNSCQRLEKICTNIEKIVDDMQQLVARIAALCKLEERNENRKPMFLTWPASRFVEVSQQIYQMYHRELQMKLTVKDELCFCTDKDTLTLLEAIWLQEPYIEKYVNFNHEVMLKEVGHTPSGAG